MQDRGSSMEQSSASPSWEISKPPISTGSPSRSVVHSRDVTAPLARAAPSSPPASLEERRELAESLDDPLNRWYRYPAARGLLRIAGGLPLRPDHVTYIHTVFGVTGAAILAWGSSRG